MVDSDDVELIRRVIQRDEQALTLLYDQYGNIVYSLALRILRNEQLAEEITQDTFLKLWNQAHLWDSTRGRLVVWILTITRYTAIDRIRAEKRRPLSTETPIEDLSPILGEPSKVEEPEWQNRRIISGLLGELPPEQVQVIEMAFYQGYTHNDIAVALNLPLGTVKTRLRLALQKLKGLWLMASGETKQRQSYNVPVTTPTKPTSDQM